MSLNTTKLKDLAISGSGLIFDPSTGVIYTSNPVGTLIINELKDGKTGANIVIDILDTFEADKDMVEKDMFDFINQLIAWGLISDE